MAESFNRTSAALGTSAASVYQAPNNGASDRSVVLSIMVANVDGANAADVTCYLADAGNTGISGGMIAKTISVPADSSLELVANKLILKNGEQLYMSASAAGDLEVTVSVLEII